MKRFGEAQKRAVIKATEKVMKIMRKANCGVTLVYIETEFLKLCEEEGIVYTTALVRACDSGLFSLKKKGVVRVVGQSNNMHDLHILVENVSRLDRVNNEIRRVHERIAEANATLSRLEEKKTKLQSL
jgi:chromosome segregation ATPase